MINNTYKENARDRRSAPYIFFSYKVIFFLLLTFITTHYIISAEVNMENRFKGLYDEMDNMDKAKVLADIRSDRDMSLREMATVLGCDYSYISKIERGKKPMTHKMAKRIIEAFLR